MPMTEPLQKALIEGAPVDKIAVLLKRDGVNCRESLTYDTPLIIAARHNHLEIAEYILSQAKGPNDKNSILNIANKKKQTPLGASLTLTDDKKIALLLIKNGADVSSGLTHEIPRNNMEWLQTFIDYNDLAKSSQLNPDEKRKKAVSAREIGNRYYNEVSDVTEATKWFELAANDNDTEAMLNLALIYQAGDSELAEKAVAWYQRCYFQINDLRQKQLILNQLEKLMQEKTLSQTVHYNALMMLGKIFADQGDLKQALKYFSESKKSYADLPKRKEEYISFFKACDFWSGTFNEDIGLLDYLDLTMRFNWFIQSGVPEARTLYGVLTSAKTPRILQIIACILGKESNFIKEDTILANPENQIYIQALSSLYGWKGQPKNALRAAGNLKKIVATLSDKETAYFCHLMIAYAYLQQEKEQEAYQSEAMQALDNAHDCVYNRQTLLHKEIIQILEMAAGTISGEVSRAYAKCLVNVYLREAKLSNIQNMKTIGAHLLDSTQYLDDEMTEISERLLTCYRTNKDKDLRGAIVDFLTELKDRLDNENPQQLVLEKALAECSQSSIDENDFAPAQLDKAVNSYKKLSDKGDKTSSDAYQKKYIDTLIMRAESNYKQGQFETALKDYSEAYEAAKSIVALTKIAKIETELGLYDEAIAHYQLLLADSSIQTNTVELRLILNDLIKMSDELIEKDKRRQEIRSVAKIIIQALLVNEENKIKRLDSIEELKNFANFIQNDAEVLAKIEEIESKILPQEKERMQQEAADAEHLRYIQKQIEPRGRSAKHHLAILLSLAESEKENEAVMNVINDVIQKWIEAAVELQNNEILLTNESSLIELANLGYLSATLYLARFQQQQGHIASAMTLYARIMVSEDKSNQQEKFREQAKQSLQACINASGEGIFSKLAKYSPYAKDLLDVIEELPSVIYEEVDKMIAAGLRNKKTMVDGMSVHNLYLIEIKKILQPK